MKTRTVRIGGMTCVNCQNRIEKALRAAEGVAAARVSYGAGTAEITYDAGVISLDDIEDIIKKLGYEAGDSAAERKPVSSASRTAGLVVIIIAAAALFDRFGAALFSAFPTAEAGMSLGMMFIIGLITSVHCVAMCGGINLSQTLGKGGVAQNASVLAGGALLPSFLYNGGRVISYTVIGGVVGAAGSVLSLSGRARGVVQIAAGVFMVIMGMNMLGVFPFLRALTPRLPRFLAAKLDGVKTRNNSPLVIGLLNGFMPCGPLQAMQLYALSTGSAAKGAASMLLFSLGTVPLMFGLGALGTFLSSRPAITRRVMTVGACVVAIMGISMFSQGAALSGLSLSALLPAQPSLAGGRDAPGGSTLKIVDGVQVVNSILSPGRYPAITVQAGIPVKWTIHAPEGSINGCNNRVIIPQYNIQHRFRPGENVIEFTPEEAGKFRYSCWMGMIRSSITVVADSAALAAASAAVDPLAPVPAGYTIPADEMAIAEPGDYNGNKIQRVSLTLTDEGFRPAVAVVEKGVPTEWVIDNRSIEDGSAELRVPLYTTILPLTKQALNPLYLQPESDFDFSTGDSIFFGYMKVVDDISGIDRESIQKEVAAFETQVYSDEYFETGADGGCCGRGSGNY